MLELLGYQRFQRGALNFAKIGNVALDLVFPFPAPEGTVGALRFYGLEAFLAVAPDAERNSALAELMLRRIEIDRGKRLAGSGGEPQATAETDSISKK
jgi:hypothetical protein